MSLSSSIGFESSVWLRLSSSSSEDESMDMPSSDSESDSESDSSMEIGCVLVEPEACADALIWASGFSRSISFGLVGGGSRLGSEDEESSSEEFDEKRTLQPPAEERFLFCPHCSVSAGTSVSAFAAILLDSLSLCLSLRPSDFADLDLLSFRTSFAPSA